MTASVLLAFAGVLFIALIGFVFAWFALTPVDSADGQRPLEQTLERIEKDVKHARELLGAKR